MGVVTNCQLWYSVTNISNGAFDMAMSNRERQRRYRERARAALAKVQDTGPSVSNGNTLIGLMTAWWRDVGAHDDIAPEALAYEESHISYLLTNFAMLEHEKDEDGMLKVNGDQYLSEEPRVQALADLLGREYVEAAIQYKNECQRIRRENYGKKKAKREPLPDMPKLP